MKKLGWKRIVAVAMSALMLLGLCGCGEGGTEGSGDKTVVTLAFWNPEPTMRPLLDLLEEKLPDIEVKFNFTANTNYGVTQRTQILSGAGDDIVALSLDFTEGMLEQGLFEDLTDIVKDDFMLSEEDYIDGKIYYVPMATWYEGIYYNKDIFEENNIEVPKTYDELLDVCDKLNAKGIKPYAIGGGTASTLLKHMLGYVQSEYMLQEEGKDFNEKFAKGEAKMADCLTPYVEEWSEIAKRGHINSMHLGMDENQAPDEFVIGVAAMWSSGTWSYNTVKQKNPNLNFGFMPYPGSKPENASLVGSYGGVLALNKNCKNKEAARRVLEVIASAEGQLALCQGEPGSGSLRKGVTTDIPKEFEDARETIERGRILCSWNFWPSGVFDSFSRSLQNIVANPSTTDIKAELKKIDDQVEKQLQAME